jgi:phosphoribosyl 1,2-cyclic phosphate phosphodiesterase
LIKLLFLGTGTSSGVPVLGCQCETCRSTDPKDKRFRTSVYLTTSQGTKILIDVSPDFRLQSLAHNICWLDGVLITHTHNDHIGGLDELRQLNFLMQRNITVYGNALALQEIQTRFNYIFKETQKGGGKPQLDLHLIEAQREFSINGQPILPVEVYHGKISILGYKIARLVYITDASYLTPATLESLKDTEILVMNALRFRPHSTHFSLAQTLEMIDRIKPREAYLVHMTHDIRHAEVEPTLPDHVHLAYDNLEVVCPE